MTWSNAATVGFGPTADRDRFHGHALDDEAAGEVIVSTKCMAYRGYLRSADEHVVVIDTKGGVVRKTPETILRVVPVTYAHLVKEQKK